MPDDQNELDIVQEHFVITMDSLKNALQRGIDPFYNHVLDGLEAMAEMIQAYENGELEIEPMEQIQVFPLEEMKELKPWKAYHELYNNINACPVCSSTNIEKVIIIKRCVDDSGYNEQRSNGYRCNECKYTYGVEFYIHNDIEPNPSKNSD